MSDDVPFQAETRERLRRLEREVRWWRFGVTACCSVAAMALLGAMAAPPAGELRAHSLRIVDKGGTDRIVLTAEPSLPDMTFLDPSGKSRLTLDIADDKSPVFALSDQGQDNAHMTFGLGASGLPELRLSAGPGKRSVTVGVPSSGGAVVRLLDEQGRLLMRVP